MSATPGSWAVVEAKRGFVITDKSGQYDIAVVRDIGGHDNKANAYLAAAAPDLLAVAECHQAAVTPGLDAVAVLTRHGWQPQTETAERFLARITDAAITKAKVAP